MRGKKTDYITKMRKKEIDDIRHGANPFVFESF